LIGHNDSIPVSLRVILVNRIKDNNIPWARKNFGFLKTEKTEQYPFIEAILSIPGSFIGEPDHDRKEQKTEESGIIVPD
jgi:hypothetical protein